MRKQILYSILGILAISIVLITTSFMEVYLKGWSLYIGVAQFTLIVILAYLISKESYIKQA